jgi:hypothetical protein
VVDDGSYERLPVPAHRVKLGLSLDARQDEALLDILKLICSETVPTGELTRFDSNESEGGSVWELLKIVVHVFSPWRK